MGGGLKGIRQDGYASRSEQRLRVFNSATLATQWHSVPGGLFVLVCARGEEGEVSQRREIPPSSGPARPPCLASAHVATRGRQSL